MIRVGFLIPALGSAWFGGLNYFRNLFKAISAAPNKIAAVAFMPRNPEIQLPSDFPPMELFRTSLLDRWSPAWVARMGLREISKNDYLMARKLEASGIDILSHSGPLGSNVALPAMSWIPDFQHFHLPDMFNLAERQRRDKTLAMAVERSSLTIVSSEAARRDLQTFFKSSAEKARVLRFADCSTHDVLGSDASFLRQKYSFRGNYFLLPNQFWAHKNHRVIIKALGLLRRQGEHVVVLATGNTIDSRHPTFFAELMNDVKTEGVEDQFRVLGIIPYPDLVGLMRGAVAIINPSLFEGWSTSVEEAKSLGKRTLLSAIPVHREQAPHRAVFFEPDDYVAAAAAILELLQTHSDHDDQVAMAMARQQATERKMQFAQDFYDIAADALALRKKS